ncbi:GNAT family N-acetyltransferase [Methanohalobium sp.]|uniref:GNAT family N-acetyltransferase n=1 Tax=Methanohalobium sp. TaxID=2837493 RepID=UPI0025F51C84|nr:GNAT family N-acetyltransferase [Methanohalobium sp.]
MDSDIRIREATNVDLLSVRLLLSTCFLEMDDVAIDNFVVAETIDRTKIIGIAAEVSRNYPEIHTVAVHPNYRAKGIGSKLVRYILDRQPEQRERIYVHTVAPEFFNKLGLLRTNELYYRGYITMYYPLI